MSLFSKKKKKDAPPPKPVAGRMAPKPDVAPEEDPDAAGGGIIQTVTKQISTPQGKAVLGALALWGVAMYLHTKKR